MANFSTCLSFYTVGFWFIKKIPSNFAFWIFDITLFMTYKKKRRNCPFVYRAEHYHFFFTDFNFIWEYEHEKEITFSLARKQQNKTAEIRKRNESKRLKACKILKQ